MRRCGGKIGRSSIGIAVAVALATGGSIAPAAAADGPDLRIDRDQEVTIDAEEISYDNRDDTVSAAGEVEIRHGDTVLRADRVKVNRTTQDAVADGGAVLQNPDVTIRAQQMQINLIDETGTLLGVEIQSDTLGYTIGGERIEKREGQNYRIENGHFTTCQCPDPDQTPPWSVSGESLDIDLDGYGHVRGGRLRVRDVPILYIPRAAFPVSRARHSGLLFPRMGFSNRRGFQILQPLYWAIDKSQDATFSLDIESAQRFGLITEHRYAIDRDSGGEMQVMYFNEFIRGRATETSLPGLLDVNVPENRWGVVGQHSYTYGSSEIYADLLLLGDDLFLREINIFTLDESEDVTLRTRPFTTTRAGLVHRWGRAYAQVEGAFHQNLLGREAFVLQTTPKAEAVAQKQLGAGLMGTVDASAVNFERSTGITGARVDVSPRLELRLPLGRSFTGAVSAAYRETGYALSQDRMFGGFNGQAAGAEAERLINLPSTSSREAVEVRGNLRTGLARVFEFPHFGLSRLKHTIEPQLEYLYIPAINQEQQPIFDGDDRLASRNVVSYGFASRVLGKRRVDSSESAPAEDVFELARVSLVQSHDFTAQVPQQGSLDERNSFSDLDFAMRINPAQGASLRFESTYDPDDADLTSATVAVLFREPAWLLPSLLPARILRRSSFGLQYRFIADNSVPGTTAVEQIDSSVVLRITEQVGVRYSSRFNIADNRLLSNFFGLSYLSECDCWSVDLGVSDRSNPNEVQFQFQFNLLGFGSAEGGSRSGVRQ